MNKLNPACAAIFLAVTLCACDRDDTQNDRTLASSDSDASAVAASRDGTTADSAASNGTAADGMNPASDATNPNGMTRADGSSSTDDASMPGTPTAAGSADADFYRQALGSGASEVALSEHASRTSSSTEVKRIAEMLIADHRALNAKLRSASGMGEVMPPPAEVKAGEAIKAMTGNAYDIAYLQKMSDGHRKSIALYEATATGASDSGTRELASAALPKLREHAGHVEKAMAAVSSPR